MQLAALLAALLVSYCAAQGQACEADGARGTCININTQNCAGEIVPNDVCPGPNNIECCLTNFGSCNVNGQEGICIPTSECDGTPNSGDYCPGPDNIQCCLNGSGSWNVSDVAAVSAAWLANGIKYNWTPNVRQYINYGPGLYRSDCSGFVSAAWNFPPPGAITADFPCYDIDASELRPGDALIVPGDHVALFWGWVGSNPLVIEECGSYADCCGNQATCPGKCGSENDCDDYCPGCPIQKRTWNGLQGFQPCRRNGW